MTTRAAIASEGSPRPTLTAAHPIATDPVAALFPDGTADAVDAALRSVLGSVVRDRRRLVAAVLPAVGVDPIACYGAARATGSATLFHQPNAGRSIVGIGAATTIPVDGPGAFDRAADAWRTLVDDAAVGGPAAGWPGAGPLLVGAAPFAMRRSTTATWVGFETGRLVLPRIVLAVAGPRTTLTAALVLDVDDDADAALGAVRERLERLSAPPAPGPLARPTPSSPLLRVLARVPDRAAWSSSVARAAGAVARGRLDKVVLARRVDLAASVPLDVPEILRRLERGAPGSTLFAIGDATGRTFLGATPERLVATHGRTFRTVALAGTIGRGDDDIDDDRLATDLLASEKDREEHGIVVAMLRETLQPVAERLEIARTPHVVRLRTVQHLATDVSGELRDGEGILGLVERLHPTPAVGGWPRDEALDLIDEQEGIDRGWYAGPLGWLDSRGDGEFVVAIRSGVIDGTEASLFAGCGIVADSEPDREWEESELKLRALASAIGRVDG